MVEPYYRDESVTIYHGDCRKVLGDIGIPGTVVVTDPPYGLGHASNYSCATTTAEWINSAIRGDESPALRDEVLASCHAWACFGSPKIPEPPLTRGVLVWDKGPASGMGDLAWPWKLSWELIFIGGGGWSGSRDEGVIKGHHVVTRKSMGRTHPNEKPVSLMAYLIRKHPARVVVDPFMGTGATLVAAKAENRSAIGVEIEERYCEIAAERCRQEVLAL